jgi:hypothetical protein
METSQKRVVLSTESHFSPRPSAHDRIEMRPDPCFAMSPSGGPTKSPRCYNSPNHASRSNEDYDWRRSRPGTDEVWPSLTMWPLVRISHHRLQQSRSPAKITAINTIITSTPTWIMSDRLRLGLLSAAVACRASAANRQHHPADIVPCGHELDRIEPAPTPSLALHGRSVERNRPVCSTSRSRAAETADPQATVKARNAWHAPSSDGSIPARASRDLRWVLLRACSRTSPFSTRFPHNGMVSCVIWVTWQRARDMPRRLQHSQWWLLPLPPLTRCLPIQLRVRFITTFSVDDHMCTR